MFTRQRFVVVGVVALAVLLGITLSKLTEWTWVQLAWDDPYIFGIRQLAVTSVIAFGLATASAIFALRYQPVFTLANEVVDELAKVSWPTREETGNATVVVIATVFVCAAFLGIFDAAWLFLTNLVLGITPESGG